VFACCHGRRERGLSWSESLKFHPKFYDSKSKYLYRNNLVISNEYEIPVMT
jgi:hypothetical protein